MANATPLQLSRLESLPAELRNMIWDFTVVRRGNPFKICSARKGANQKRGLKNPNFSPLFSVNKLVSKEAIHIFYTCNTFLFSNCQPFSTVQPNLSACSDFVRRTPKSSIELIRNIEVAFDFPRDLLSQPGGVPPVSPGENIQTVVKFIDAKFKNIKSIKISIGPGIQKQFGYFGLQKFNTFAAKIYPTISWMHIQNPFVHTLNMSSVQEIWWEKNDLGWYNIIKSAQLDIGSFFEGFGWVEESSAVGENEKNETHAGVHRLRRVKPVGEDMKEFMVVFRVIADALN